MIRALIVDDEVRAIRSLRTVLEWYCDGEVEVVGEANNPSQAWPLIQEVQPDLIFLDVEMGDENGFMLLEKLRKTELEVRVIFTTGHAEFAIDALRQEAFDYLLKPVSGEDLQAAVRRLKESDRHRAAPGKSTPAKSRISLSMQDQVLIIDIAEIVRLESDRNYTRFFLADNNQYLATRNMGYFQKQLSDYAFFRSHKSHLINLDQLKSYIRENGGYLLMKDGSEVPVSRTQRAELFRLLGI